MEQYHKSNNSLKYIKNNITEDLINYWRPDEITKSIENLCSIQDIPLEIIIKLSEYDNNKVQSAFSNLINNISEIEVEECLINNFDDFYNTKNKAIAEQFCKNWLVNKWFLYTLLPSNDKQVFGSILTWLKKSYDYEFESIITNKDLMKCLVNKWFGFSILQIMKEKFNMKKIDIDHNNIDRTHSMENIILSKPSGTNIWEALS